MKNAVVPRLPSLSLKAATEAGLHLLDRFQRLFREERRAAALPREPSGGRKRQGTFLSSTQTPPLGYEELFLQ